MACVLLTIIFGVQTAGHLFLITILLFLDDRPYLTVDLIVNPVQWQNRLLGSLWVWAPHLFMGLIACSSSSLGDEMFELLGQSTDVVLASSVQLEKGRRKERKKKKAITCDIIITHGAFLSQKAHFWIADSAVCCSIKHYQADEQMITNQMGNERCLNGMVWRLTEIASYIINFQLKRRITTIITTIY